MSPPAGGEATGAMSADRALLGELRDLWERADPVPGDLVDQILFALRLEDLEVELMRLHEAVEPVGARGAGTAVETASTMTFSSSSLTVMLAVAGDGDDGPRRIDGWLAPAADLRVELRTGSDAAGEARSARADSDGRFSFEHVPAGVIQLRMLPTEGAAVALDRPVATPAVRI